MIRSRRTGSVTTFQLARTVAGNAWYWQACYHVGETLIDCGPPVCAQELADAVQPLPLVQVVVTHRHEDHIGGAALLQQQRQVRLFAPVGSLPYLADPRRLHMQLYRRLTWGVPKPAQAAALGDWFDAGDYRFRVLPAPGHCPDHVVLYEPRQCWCFCADAFIGGEDRTWRRDNETDLAATLGTLRMLAGLDISLLFPGSGRVRENPRAEIEAKIDYLERCLDRVKAMDAAGMTERQIARRLFGRDPFLTYFSRGHYSSLNLVRACLETNSGSISYN